MDVRESYDSAARAYAAHLLHELDGKPLDRHLLERFAEAVRGGGLVADLGCGPGHVARFLHERGVRMLGVDLSPAMIEQAAGLHRGIEFRAGDMLALDLDDGALAGAVAFYSIVHLDVGGVGAFGRELARVLRPGGVALIAFHAGDSVISVDELFGAPVSLVFRFHDPAVVTRVLEAAGLRVVERSDREPYQGVEHPSRRSYLFARSDEQCVT